MNRQWLDQQMADQRLDVVISLGHATRLWFTNFDSSAGYLFIEKDAATLLIDGRYFEAAKQNAKNVHCDLLSKDNLTALITKKTAKYRRIGVESDYMTLDELTLIKKWFSKAEIINISGKKLREIKTSDEVKRIKKACEIAHHALYATLKGLVPNKTTEQEVAIELERNIKLLGGEKGSFDFIVASGERGSLPHGRASDKVIKNGELLTVDWGAYYQGYASDITRTMFIGKVTNPKLLEIASVLKDVQSKTIKIVRPGATTNEIDAFARNLITAAGYGPNFVHSTGHGLGIDVHELPVVTSNPDYNTVLKPGMVITIEPGIYLPGIGGIRIEDDVLVTDSSYEVLSKNPKGVKYD